MWGKEGGVKSGGRYVCKCMFECTSIALDKYSKFSKMKKTKKIYPSMKIVHVSMGKVGRGWVMGLGLFVCDPLERKEGKETHKRHRDISTTNKQTDQQPTKRVFGSLSSMSILTHEMEGQRFFYRGKSASKWRRNMNEHSKSKPSLAALHIPRKRKKVSDICLQVHWIRLHCRMRWDMK